MVHTLGTGMLGVVTCVNRAVAYHRRACQPEGDGPRPEYQAMPQAEQIVPAYLAD